MLTKGWVLGSLVVISGTIRPVAHADPAPTLEPVAATAHILSAADLEARLDGFLPYALARADIAGGVISVVAHQLQ